jgi:hypothetical protein
MAQPNAPARVSDDQVMSGGGVLQRLSVPHPAGQEPGPRWIFHAISTPSGTPVSSGWHDPGRPFAPGEICGERSMSTLGCGFGLLAGLTFLVGIIPFLGWINWFTTLPLAVVSAAMAYSAMKNGRDDGVARFTLVASVLLIVVTLGRLSIGGGFI